MSGVYYKKYSPAEIRSAFNQFDRDRNGYITASELQEVLDKMGRRYTRSEIENMIRSVDRDRNGKISIEEFSQLFK